MRNKDACSWLLTQTRWQEPSPEDTTNFSYRIQKHEGTIHFVYKTQRNQDSFELDLSTCWLTFTVLEGAMQATSRENSSEVSCLLQYVQARYAHWGIVAGL